MADIFTKANAQHLLRKKTIWLLGDSNVRGNYKDLVWLLQKNSLISLENLRMKLEKSHMGDTLVKGKKLERGRTYIEERKYHNFECQTTIEFTFLTKCLNEEFEEKLRDVRHKKREAPDVLVMNSCLWDIVRWGPDGVNQYKRNIVKLMNILKSTLPPTTLVIWTTTPPIAAEPSGGFLIKQIEFMKHTIRFEVMEANMFVRQEVVAHGFDVLDIHYHLLLQIHRRRPDGIHWDVDAVRHITNLILTHIALSWGMELPGNFKSKIVEKMKSFVPEPLDQSIKELNKLGKFLKPNEPKRSNGQGKNDRNGNYKNNRRRNKRSRFNDDQDCNVNNTNDDDYNIWDNQDNGNSMNSLSNSMNPMNPMGNNMNPMCDGMNQMGNNITPLMNSMNPMSNSIIPNINMALMNMAMNPMNQMNNNMNSWNYDNNFQMQSMGLLNNLNNFNNFNNMNSANSGNGFNDLNHGYAGNNHVNQDFNNRKYENRKRRNYRPY